MRRKQFLMLLATYLSGVLTCFIASCANGPQVNVYTSDPARGGMEMYSPKNNKTGFVPYSQTDKFVCFTPPDVQTLLDYCSAK